MQHPRSKTTWIRSIATAVLLLCAALMLRLNIIPVEVLNIPIYPYAVFGALLACYAALHRDEGATLLPLEMLPALAYLVILCLIPQTRMTFRLTEPQLGFWGQFSEESYRFVEGHPFLPVLGTYGWMLMGFAAMSTVLALPRAWRKDKPIAWDLLLKRAALWLGIALAVTVFDNVQPSLANFSAHSALLPTGEIDVASRNLQTLLRVCGFSLLPVVPGILLGRLYPLQKLPKGAAIIWICVCSLLWITTTGQSVMDRIMLTVYYAPDSPPFVLYGFSQLRLGMNSDAFTSVFLPALGTYITALGVLFGHAVQSLRGERKAKAVPIPHEKSGV